MHDPTTGGLTLLATNRDRHRPAALKLSLRAFAGGGHRLVEHLTCAGPSDDDGRTWMVHHAWPPGSVGSAVPGRTMWLTELTWDDDRPVLDGPRADVRIAP